MHSASLSLCSDCFYFCSAPLPVSSSATQFQLLQQNSAKSFLQKLQFYLLWSLFCFPKINILMKTKLCLLVVHKTALRHKPSPRYSYSNNTGLNVSGKWFSCQSWPQNSQINGVWGWRLTKADVCHPSWHPHHGNIPSSLLYWSTNIKR